jgi:hypothetical protein
MGGQLRLFWTHLNRLFSIRSQKQATARREIRLRRSTVSRVPADIEQLESRALLSAAAVLAQLNAVPTIDVMKQAATPASAGGYTPSQLQTAYGFNLVSLSSGANGTGQTIAIVDAYNDPTIQNDLRAFDSNYGLANPPSLTVMSQTGSTTSLPSVDPSSNKSSDWEVEESLDVEWAHALAPGAKIVLVEANSSSYADLMTAVQTAANLPGVSVVSMSWGGGEFSSESAYDSIFKTPTGHQGVTFVASTGDNGTPGGFPAYSSNVLAVGGTTLNLSSSGSYLSESAWSLSGGGISQYETQPAYQRGIVTQTSTNRAIPDVSFDANPNTGVEVYDTFSFGTSSPWAQIGGTSLSAPAWASVIATVDQGRVQNGLTTLDGASQTLPMLYQLDQTDPAAFHDITSGNNGYSAGIGYDLVTGLGSPVVNNLVNALDTSSTTTTASKLVVQQSPTTGTAGLALSPSLTVAIENQSGQVVSTDNSTVTITVSTGPGSFASSSTVSVKAVNGTATFNNLVLNTAGSYTLSVSDGSDTSATTHAISISAAQASKVVFQQQPTTGIAGQPLSTVSAVVEDQFGNVVMGNNSTVTIAVASGPGNFSSNSTTSVKAVNGIATFSNLVLATAGAYSLKVSDTGLTGATSNSFTISSTNSVLSAPQNVTLVALSTTTALLSWNTVSGAQGYRVYFVAGSQTTLLGSVNSSSTSVQIAGLSAGSTVSFKVEAYNATSIADSRVVSVTMPSTTASSIVLTEQSLTATAVQLSWTPVSGAQGYRIYWSNGSQHYLLATISSRTTNSVVAGLVPGASYQFMVEAYAGTSVLDSNWVSVTAAARHTRGAAKSVVESGLPTGFAADSFGRLRK